MFPTRRGSPYAYIQNEGGNVGIYYNSDISGDGLKDSFMLTESYFSEWMGNDTILGLINPLISDSNFGLSIVSNKEVADYWTSTKPLSQRINKFSFLLLERKEPYSNKIVGCKMVVYYNGHLFLQTPPLIEYVKLRIAESIPVIAGH